jgi:hypothetical protein
MVILPLKVLKLSNRGSQTFSSPLATKPKGFLFSLNYFSEKEGFLIKVQYIINKGSLS